MEEIEETQITQGGSRLGEGQKCATPPPSRLVKGSGDAAMVNLPSSVATGLQRDSRDRDFSRSVCYKWAQGSWGAGERCGRGIACLCWTKTLEAPKGQRGNLANATWDPPA